MSVINRTFKSATTNMVTIYTVPSGKSAVITSLNHCNYNSASGIVSTYIENSGNFGIISTIIDLAPNASIEIIGSGQKLVLNAGDKLRFFKQYSNVDSIVTLMEID